MFIVKKKIIVIKTGKNTQEIWKITNEIIGNKHKKSILLKWIKKNIYRDIWVFNDYFMNVGINIENN